MHSTTEVLSTGKKRSTSRSTIQCEKFRSCVSRVIRCIGTFCWLFGRKSRWTELPHLTELPTLILPYLMIYGIRTISFGYTNDLCTEFQLPIWRRPLHFAIHKPGCHFESCCGVCNLFPGVLLIAFCQVLVGAVLLTLLLSNGKDYDALHQTPSNQLISFATGAVLSGVTGAGLLLIVVALTENCKAMLVYLLVALIVMIGIASLGIFKISHACGRFHDAPKIKDEQHRLANLACVSGLLTFFGSVVYFFSFVVVFSFYHFRYVRRAILLHEAECE